MTPFGRQQIALACARVINPIMAEWRHRESISSVHSATPTISPPLSMQAVEVISGFSPEKKFKVLSRSAD
jgi:hypothetical protein